MSYAVSLEDAAPRTIAAVRARLPIQRVASTFRTYLDQVYAAGRAGLVRLDGQNIFVYRNVPGSEDEADVDFGVGITAPFSPSGQVRPVELPIGRAATTTHWGNYSRLGDAHAAVIDWCRSHGHAVAGTSWEVYGHWTDDESKLRTDVYHLLA